MDLNKLKELCVDEYLSPSPWKAFTGIEGVICDSNKVIIAKKVCDSDAEFIVAARTVLPLLIKIVEAAKEDTQYMKTSPLDGAYIAGASAGNLCNSITWRKTLNALAEFEKG